MTNFSSPFRYKMECIPRITAPKLGYYVAGVPRSTRLRIERSRIRGCIQKFLDWPPGARTANGTALCH
jgi:hypothetical protein